MEITLWNLDVRVSCMVEEEPAFFSCIGKSLIYFPGSFSSEGPGNFQVECKIQKCNLRTRTHDIGVAKRRKEGEGDH